jgi:hypothetical protein
MNNKIISNRVKKLLSFKNKEYKKKFYILSRLSESSIKNKSNLLEEFKCLSRSLNESNGEFPSTEYLYEFSSKVFNKQKIEDIKESVCLEYPNVSCSYKSIINEELDKVIFINKDLDLKLENLLLKSISESVSLLEENELEDNDDILFVSDQTSDDQNMGEEDNDEERHDKLNPQKTSSNIINKYSFLFRKENIIPLIRNKLNIFLPDPVEDKNWDMNKLAHADKLYIITMYRLIIEQNSSNKAIRKFLMFEKIRSYLNIRQQFIDVSTYAIQGGGGSVTTSPTRLSQDKINSLRDEYNNLVSKIGPFKGQSLDSEIVPERDVLSLLFSSSGELKDDAKMFVEYLERFYPDNKMSDLEKDKVLSDVELEELRLQNIEFDKKFDEESFEIDDETGEPRYADDEQIKNINQKRIEDFETFNTKEIKDQQVKPEKMTSIKAVRFFKDLDEDLKRLEFLHNKSISKVNPEIFNTFETDSSGKIIPDIELIPDIIPMEGLTDSEKEEIVNILQKLSKKKNIVMINLDRRGDVYNEMSNKNVNFEQMREYLIDFGLDVKGEPKTWSDIARSSYQLYKNSGAARQSGQKSWQKELFFSSNSKEKSRIYASAGDLWCERLIRLDFLDDEAFVRVPSIEDMNDSSKDKNISKEKLLEKEDILLSSIKSFEEKKQSEGLSDVEGSKLEYFKELISIVKDIKDFNDIDSFETIQTCITTPKIIEKFFDTNSDSSLETSINEKLNSILNSYSSESEIDQLLKDLVEKDKDVARYAILDSMFVSNSSFKIFVNNLCKKFYDKYVWSECEKELAQSIKKYFDTHYGKGSLAASLPPGGYLKDINKEDGIGLVNKIILLAMERTGIKSGGSKGSIPEVGYSDTVLQRMEYALGDTKDQRGNFVKSIRDFNETFRSEEDSSKILGIDGGEFGRKDVEKLLEDIFNPNSSNSIIGPVYEYYKKLTTSKADELVSWMMTLKDTEVDQLIVDSLAENSLYTNDSRIDPFMIDILKTNTKDSKEALKQYKKKFAGALSAKPFLEYLEYELG